MNLFEDLGHLPPMEESPDDREPMTRSEQHQCEAIAKQLIEKSGWTGAQIEWLESIIAGREDDPFTLDELTEMAEKREREENLNRQK